MPGILVAAEGRAMVESWTIFYHSTDTAMALNIKNEQTHALVRRLAELTGESLTEAVTTAVRERLEHVHQADEREISAAAIAEIQRFLAGLPDLDTRCADDILGYDAFGLPR